MAKYACPDCRDKGWLIFQDQTIQRCDGCQKFDGDLSAAVAYFDSKGCKHWLEGIVIKPKKKGTK